MQKVIALVELVLMISHFVQLNFSRKYKQELLTRRTEVSILGDIDIFPQQFNIICIPSIFLKFW